MSNHLRLEISVNGLLFKTKQSTLGVSKSNDVNKFPPSLKCLI